MLRGSNLPKEIKEDINQAKSVDEILDVLDENQYHCNWSNVRWLKIIAKNLNNEKAQKVIQIYEDNVYNRKISNVQHHFYDYSNAENSAVIEAKINKSPEDVTVRDILKCCSRLENTMDLYAGITSVTGISSGCMKITVVIPLYCSLHAYKFANNNRFKLRKLHIQYLEFHFHYQYLDIDLPDQVLPAKVYAFNYPDVEDALSSYALKC